MSLQKPDLLPVLKSLYDADPEAFLAAIRQLGAVGPDALVSPMSGIAEALAPLFPVQPTEAPRSLMPPSSRLFIGAASSLDSIRCEVRTIVRPDPEHRPLPSPADFDPDQGNPGSAL